MSTPHEPLKTTEDQLRYIENTLRWFASGGSDGIVMPSDMDMAKEALQYCRQLKEEGAR